jgi:hypothetical protein
MAGPQNASIRPAATDVILNGAIIVIVLAALRWSSHSVGTPHSHIQDAGGQVPAHCSKWGRERTT